MGKIIGQRYGKYFAISYREGWPLRWQKSFKFYLNKFDIILMSLKFLT